MQIKVGNLDCTARAAIGLILLSLARRPHLRVVAKGVEAVAQVDALFQHRCDAIQGFLFARQMLLELWLGYSDQTNTEETRQSRDSSWRAM